MTIQNNLNKPKIVEIRDKEYSEGNIFFLKIEISQELNRSIISLLQDFGFSNKSLEDFDNTYEDEELFIFSMDKKVRVSVINSSSEKEIVMIIDGKIEKKSLMEKLKKYFSILN